MYEAYKLVLRSSMYEINKTALRPGVYEANKLVLCSDMYEANNLVLRPSMYETNKTALKPSMYEENKLVFWPGMYEANKLVLRPCMYETNNTALRPSMYEDNKLVIWPGMLRSQQASPLSGYVRRQHVGPMKNILAANRLNLHPGAAMYDVSTLHCWTSTHGRKAHTSGNSFIAISELHNKTHLNEQAGSTQHITCWKTAGKASF
jgi:hypothetical protein